MNDFIPVVDAYHEVLDKKNCHKFELLYSLLTDNNLISKQLYTLVNNNSVSGEDLMDIRRFLENNKRTFDNDELVIKKYINKINEAFEQQYIELDLEKRLITTSASVCAKEIYDKKLISVSNNPFEFNYERDNQEFNCNPNNLGGRLNNKCRFLMRIIYGHLNYYEAKKMIIDDINNVIINFNNIKECKNNFENYRIIKDNVENGLKIFNNDYCCILRSELNDDEAQRMINKLSKPQREKISNLKLKMEHRDAILWVNTGLTAGIAATGYGAPLAAIPGLIALTSGALRWNIQHRSLPAAEEKLNQIKRGETIKSYSVFGIETDEDIVERVTNTLDQGFSKKKKNCTQQIFENERDLIASIIVKLHSIKKLYTFMDKLLTNIYLHELYYQAACVSFTRSSADIQRSIEIRAIESAAQIPIRERLNNFNNDHPYFSNLHPTAKDLIINYDDDMLNRLEQYIEREIADNNRTDWRPNGTSNYIVILGDRILPCFNNTPECDINVDGNAGRLRPRQPRRQARGLGRARAPTRGLGRGRGRGGGRTHAVEADPELAGGRKTKKSKRSRKSKTRKHK